MRIILALGIFGACSEYSIDSVDKTNGEEVEEETETEVNEETPEPEDDPDPEPEAPIEEGTPPVADCDVSPNPVNPFSSRECCRVSSRIRGVSPPYSGCPQGPTTVPFGRQIVGG